MGDVTATAGPTTSGAARRRRAARSACAACRSSTCPVATSRSPTRDGSSGRRLQRRDLQLPRTAPRTAGAGYRFKTGSDSEVCCTATRSEGERFVRAPERHVRFRALGRAAQTLLVGRDRLGIKPIYWLDDGTPRGVRLGGQGAARACPACAPRSIRPRWPTTCDLGYVPAPHCHVPGHPQAADRPRC